MGASPQHPRPTPNTHSPHQQILLALPSVSTRKLTTFHRVHHSRSPSCAACIVQQCRTCLSLSYCCPLSLCPRKKARVTLLRCKPDPFIPLFKTHLRIKTQVLLAAWPSHRSPSPNSQALFTLHWPGALPGTLLPALCRFHSLLERLS